MDTTNDTEPRNPIHDELSDLAKAVTITRTPRAADLPPPYDGDDVIFDLDGKSVLGAIVRDGTLTAIHGHTEPGHRGNGYATAVVQRAMRYAAENGLRCRTRDAINPHWVSVGRSLARKGFPIKLNFPAPLMGSQMEMDPTGSGQETTHPDALEYEWATSGMSWMGPGKREPSPSEWAAMKGPEGPAAGSEPQPEQSGPHKP
ncbi:MAG: hypothetical protein KIT85_07680 [Pseudolabrys sp.]|nr:hypothetical protein [Pseudolabrys sp.]